IPRLRNNSASGVPWVRQRIDPAQDQAPVNRAIWETRELEHQAAVGRAANPAHRVWVPAVPAQDRGGVNWGAVDLEPAADRPDPQLDSLPLMTCAPNCPQAGIGERRTPVRMTSLGFSS